MIAALEGEARVETEGLDALPSLYGDAGQIRQLFTNLVQNALQASSTDGKVRVVGQRLDGALVEIAVEDEGPGVDPEVRRRLFEPLITTKTSGIGLGLALVKRIAERHGGTVRYLPGARGARFVVTLPEGGGGA